MRSVCRRLKAWVLVVFCLAVMPLAIMHFQVRQGPSSEFEKMIHRAIIPEDTFAKKSPHLHLLKYISLNDTSAPETERPISSDWILTRDPNLASGPMRSETGDAVPLWQKVVQEGSWPKHYFLAEVLQVRIYENDKAKWTLKELKQWMHYMLWAGIQHIFICDHYADKKESIEPLLKRYIDLGLVTYFHWGETRDPMTAQVACYQTMINKYKTVTEWQIAIDMDEYPWMPNDVKEGFLVRYLQNLPEHISEVSMHNFIMMGQGDRKQDMTIARINRRTPGPANPLDKPIYRPSRVRAQIHHNALFSGKRLEVDDNDLKMLHYWGARTQKWGPDTPETIKKTIEFNDVRDRLAPVIRNSLITFGELDAFSNSTGP